MKVLIDMQIEKLWLWLKLIPGYLNTLRKLLFIGAIVIIVFPADANVDISVEGWGMWSTLMVPIFAPITFFVLLLDMMMARVVIGEYEGKQRDKYKSIVILNLLLASGIFVAWYPYFATILSSG